MIALAHYINHFIVQPIQEYLFNSSYTELSKELNMPRFPIVTAIFTFMFIGSKFLGNSISIALMILIVLMDLKWWFSFFKYSVIIRHPLKWLFLVIIALLTISTIFSKDIYHSTYSFVSTIAISYIAIGCYEILSRLDYRKWLPWLIFVNLIYTVILSLMMYFLWQNDFYNHQIIYTCWIIVCLIPIFLVSLKKKFLSNYYKLASIIIIITIAIIGFILENRSTMVAYFAIISAYMFINYHKYIWKTLLAFLLFTISLVTLITFGFQKNMLVFLSGDGHGAIFLPTWIIDPVRQATWQFAWNSIPSIPIFGYGLNASNRIEGALDKVPWLLGPPLNLKNVGYLDNSPHNVLLQWLIELGWIAFILIILFYLLLLIKLLFTQDKVLKYELLIHAGYFGIAMINGNFWSPFWIIAYVFSITIIKSISKSKKSFS